MRAQCIYNNESENYSLHNTKELIKRHINQWTVMVEVILAWIFFFSGLFEFRCKFFSHTIMSLDSHRFIVNSFALESLRILKMNWLASLLRSNRLAIFPLGIIQLSFTRRSCDSMQWDADFNTFTAQSVVLHTVQRAIPLYAISEALATASVAVAATAAPSTAITKMFHEWFSCRMIAVVVWSFRYRLSH